MNSGDGSVTGRKMQAFISIYGPRQPFQPLDAQDARKVIFLHAKGIDKSHSSPPVVRELPATKLYIVHQHKL
jgi:hypothetical protein